MFNYFNEERKIMLTPVQLIGRTVERNRKKGYCTTYILVDIHGTVLRPSKTETPRLELDYYPGAKEALRLLTKAKDIKLIMWSSCFDSTLQRYQELFYKDGIIFDFIGENTEVSSDSISCYEKKFYYDLGLDDKHGFQADNDWYDIIDYFEYLEDVRKLIKYMDNDEEKSYYEHSEVEYYSPEICKDHIYHTIKRLKNLIGE